MSKFIRRFTLLEDAITGRKVLLCSNKKRRQYKEIICSIPEDEGKLFADILSIFDRKSLYLCKIMAWSVTSKLWSICKKENKSRTNQKSLLRNHLELLSTIPPTTLPQGIQVSVVDAMQYETPSKNRNTSEWKRIVSDLDQELPDTKELSSFLSNEKNKHHLVNLLVYFILESGIIEKTIFVSKGNQSYCKRMNENPVTFEDLGSSHKETDQKLPMHSVYASQLNKKPICVTADDTDAIKELLY